VKRPQLRRGFNKKHDAVVEDPPARTTAAHGPTPAQVNEGNAAWFLHLLHIRDSASDDLVNIQYPMGVVVTGGRLQGHRFMVSHDGQLSYGSTCKQRMVCKISKEALPFRPNEKASYARPLLVVAGVGGTMTWECDRDRLYQFRLDRE